MDKQTLKQRCCEAIDQNRDAVFALADDIYRHPEMGFREFRSTNKMKEAFEKRDPEAARKMMMQMQAMVAGMGVNTPNMFNGFKFPKPPKVKEPNEVLQSAAEAKRARKAAKNLAIAQKKTLTKA